MMVSIITPTIPARRKWLLERCIPSVRAQTHKDIEHIVVSDGAGPEGEPPPEGVRYFELGRNWREFSGKSSVGAIPRLAGSLLAKGEYIGYLDDDDEFLSEHVEKLMKLLLDSGKDVAVSRFKFCGSYRRDLVVGNGTVKPGDIGTPLVLHKASCLLAANWTPNGGNCEDYELFKRWEQAGKTFVFLPEITVHVHKDA